MLLPVQGELDVHGGEGENSMDSMEKLFMLGRFSQVQKAAVYPLKRQEPPSPSFFSKRFDPGVQFSN